MTNNIINGKIAFNSRYWIFLWTSPTVEIEGINQYFDIFNLIMFANENRINILNKDCLIQPLRDMLKY